MENRSPQQIEEDRMERDIRQLEDARERDEAFQWDVHCEDMDREWATKQLKKHFSSMDEKSIEANVELFIEGNDTAVELLRSISK